MQTWLNFWVFIFWLSLFGFLLNPSNFIILLIYSEITWVGLYCYSVLCGTISDDLTLLSLTFLLLGLASLEFSVGYLLIILFKNLLKSISFFEEEVSWKNFVYNNTKKLYLNRYVWYKKK